MIRKMMFLLLTLMAFCFMTEGSKLLAHDYSSEKKHVTELYRQLFIHRYTPHVVELSDSVIVQGKPLGMIDLVTKAYMMRMFYLSQHWSSNHIEYLISETRKAQSFCLHNKMMDGYFEVWNYLLFYYSRTRFIEKRLHEIVLMRSEAKKRNMPKYVIKAEIQLANLYYQQERDELALESYRLAIKQGEKLNDKSIMEYCYDMEGTILIRQHKLWSALFAYQKALQLNRELNNSYSSRRSSYFAGLGICYYYLGKYQELNRMCDSIKSVNWRTTLFNRNNYYKLMAFYYMFHRDYPKVLLYSDSLISNDAMKYKIKELVYLYLQQYQKAIGIVDSQMYYYQHILDDANRSHDVWVNTLLDIDKTNHKTHLLSHLNTRLKLKEAAAQKKNLLNLLEQTNINRLYEIKSASNRVEMMEQRAQLDRVKSMSIQRSLLNQRKYQSMKHLLSVLLISIVIIVLVVLLVIVWKKRNYLNALRCKEQDAIASRNEAEKLRLEAEQAWREAKELDDMKSQFIKSISYEVRTPLNAIVGFSNLISTNKDMSEEEKKRYTQLIETNSKQLSSMVNQILDLTRLISGKYVFQYTQTTPDEICRTAFIKAEPAYKLDVKTDLIIDDDIASELLYTDLSRMIQALSNIISNAVKFTSKGSISVVCKRGHIGNKESVCVSVTDTGIGVPEDKKDIIFERFVKLDPFSKGNGMGLTMTKVIIEKLGGHCWLDTSYQSGSRFYLEFPINRIDPLKGGLI